MIPDKLKKELKAAVFLHFWIMVMIPIIRCTPTPIPRSSEHRRSAGPFGRHMAKPIYPTWIRECNLFENQNLKITFLYMIDGACAPDRVSQNSSSVFADVE